MLWMGLVFRAWRLYPWFHYVIVWLGSIGSEEHEGLLSLIQRNKSHHQKRAYQCLKVVTQLLGDCPAALALLEQKEDLRRRYQHCVEWLNDELERRPTYPSNQYYGGGAVSVGNHGGVSVGSGGGTSMLSGWSSGGGSLGGVATTANLSNETSQGFYLERSNSARHTLAKACQFLSGDEELEEEGWESGECSASDASGVPPAVSRTLAVSVDELDHVPVGGLPILPVSPVPVDSSTDKIITVAPVSIYNEQQQQQQQMQFPSSPPDNQEGGDVDHRNSNVRPVL